MNQNNTALHYVALHLLSMSEAAQQKANDYAAQAKRLADEATTVKAAADNMAKTATAKKAQSAPKAGSSNLSNPREVDRLHRAEDCTLCMGAPGMTEVVNHDMMWHDGDVICSKKGCGRFVRAYDAG